MNRTVLIGSIIVVVTMVAGTILIAKKEVGQQKAVSTQSAQAKKTSSSTEKAPDMKPRPAPQAVAAQEKEKTPAPALAAAGQNADVETQKIQDTKKTDKPSATSPSTEDNKNAVQDMMSMMKEKMKDPAMKEQILKMSKIQFAQAFAPFFSEVGLDEEKCEKFKDIMVDNASKSMDNTFRHLNPRHRKNLRNFAVSSLIIRE